MFLMGKILFCEEKQAIVNNTIILPMNLSIEEEKKKINLTRRQLKLNLKVKRN